MGRPDRGGGRRRPLLPWVPTFVYQAKYTAPRGRRHPNFSAVINALTGFTDNQGSTLQTGTNQGRLLAVIYFAMLGARHLRHRPVRADDRARPAHPPARPQPLLRGAGHAVRRHRRGDPDRQRVLLALRRGRVPALPPSRRAGDDDTAQSEGPCRDRRAGRGGRAGVVRPERDHAADPGRRRGRRHQRAGQARGRDRLLPRPAGPLGLPADSGPLPVRHGDLPAANGPADRQLGQLCRHRARGRPQRLCHVRGQLAGANHHVWLVWEPMYQTYGVKCETIATDLLEPPPRTAGEGATS